jgi:GT2 family glycosyltransferase
VASRSSIPSVVVIVLNWNGREDTIACVESLRQVDYSNFVVMVVDNGSIDGSVPAIRERFPSLEIVENGHNLGFAEGNNVGIRLALERGADYVFLLNNDTVAHPSLLHELVSAAERCPEGGVFSAKIFYQAEPTRIWYGGATWDPQRMEFRHLVDDSQAHTDARGVAETDYACGCAFLARSSVLRKVGLLDPKFFLIYEESDLCFRARRAGFACYYVPSAVLWHKVSSSFGGSDSPLFMYFTTRNRLLWGERHLGRRELLRLYRILWWDLNKRLIPAFEIDRHGPGLLGRFHAGIRSFASSLMERWHEPQNQAVAWGALHYFTRRFGDAPKRVRTLGRTGGGDGGTSEVSS